MDYTQSSFIRPKTLFCYICGRQFGTKSLPIHLKSCVVKFYQQQQQKQKQFRIKCPQAPQELRQILEGNLNEQVIEKYNQIAINTHKYKVLPACPYCKRTFNEESLTSHMKACSKSNESSNSSSVGKYKMVEDFKKPRTLSCCVCGREFGLTSLKIHYPQCLEKAKNQQLKKPKAQRKQIPKFTSEQVQLINQKSDWTLEQIQNFNNKAAQDYREKGLIQCSNCKRRFIPESYQKHKKNCKLINGDLEPENKEQSSSYPSSFLSEQIRKPKVLMCHICGRQFGLTSLKIHLKSCTQKFQNNQNKRQRKLRRLIPQLSISQQQYNLKQTQKWTEQMIKNYNQAADKVYKQASLFPCNICGRKFFQQALVRHKNYCQKNNEKIQEKQRQKQFQRQKSSQKLNNSSKNFNKSSVQRKETRISPKIHSKSPSLSKKQSVTSLKKQKSIQKNQKNIPKIIESKKVYESSQIDVVKQEPEQLQETIKPQQNLIDNDIQEKDQLLKKIDNQQQKEIKYPPLQERLQQNQNQFISHQKIEKKKSIKIQQKDEQIQAKQQSQVNKKQKEFQEITFKPNNLINQLNKKKEQKLSEQFQSQQMKFASQSYNNVENIERVKCIKCGRSFNQDRIQKHQQVCKGQTSNLIKKKQQKCQKIEKQKNNDKIGINFDKTKQEQIDNSGLKQCLKCSRKFNPDRIQKHQQVCKGQKSKFNKKKQPENIKKAAKTPQKQQRSFSLQKKQQIINKKCFDNQPKLNKQVQDQQQPQIQLIKCSKCQRNFASNRIEKHKAVCKPTPIFSIRKQAPIKKQSNQEINLQTKKNIQYTKKMLDQIQKEEKVRQTVTSTNFYKKQKNQQRSLQSQNNNMVKSTSGQNFYKKSKINLQKIVQTEDFSKEFQNFTQQYLVPCNKCQRKFNQDRIQKHQNICKLIKPQQEAKKYIKQRDSQIKNHSKKQNEQKIRKTKDNFYSMIQEIKHKKIKQDLIDFEIQNQLREITKTNVITGRKVSNLRTKNSNSKMWQSQNPNSNKVITPVGKWGKKITNALPQIQKV